MRLKLVTPPAVEPLTLDEAKSHAVVENPDDDALVTALIPVARRLCENATRRSFITQTWEMTLDRFPYRLVGQVLDPWAFPSNRAWLERLAIPGSGALELPRPELQSIASIGYVDPNGTTQTLDPSAYRVVTGTPGLVEPAYQTTWPAVRPVSAAVTIRFVAGYGDNATSVPDCIKHAMKMLISYLYEHKDAAEIASGLTAIELPFGVRALLATEDWGSYP